MTRSTLRKIPLLAGLLGLIAGIGCIDYQETIEVRSDGSVEITIYAAIAQAAMPMVRNRKELRQLLLLPSGAASARKQLAKSIPGVQVKYWASTYAEGVRIYDLAVTVPSVDAFRAGVGEIFSEQSFEVTRTADGMLAYRRSVAAEPVRDEMKSAMGFMRKRLEQSNLEFRLIVPTEVIETNGIRVSERETYWRSNLVRLRKHGLDMQALIALPGPLSVLGGPEVAVPAAVIGGVLIFLLWSRRRKRRRNT